MRRRGWGRWRQVARSAGDHAARAQATIGVFRTRPIQPRTVPTSRRRRAWRQAGVGGVRVARGAGTTRHAPRRQSAFLGQDSMKRGTVPTSTRRRPRRQAGSVTSGLPGAQRTTRHLPRRRSGLLGRDSMKRGTVPASTRRRAWRQAGSAASGLPGAPGTARRPSRRQSGFFRTRPIQPRTVPTSTRRRAWRRGGRRRQGCPGRGRYAVPVQATIGVFSDKTHTTSDGADIDAPAGVRRRSRWRRDGRGAGDTRCPPRRQSAFLGQDSMKRGTVPTSTRRRGRRRQGCPDHRGPRGARPGDNRRFSDKIP
jgi:hypothetical protein